MYLSLSRMGVLMKKEIWKDMLDADLNARYWGEQTRVAYSRDKWIRIFLALASSGTIAGWSIWKDFPLAWQALSAMTAVLAIASPVLNYAEKAKNSLVLYCAWSDILRAYEQLWIKVECRVLINARKLIAEYGKIVDKEKKCDSHEAKYSVDRQMLKRCWMDVLNSRGLR